MGFKDGNNSMNVKFNVSEKKKETKSSACCTLDIKGDLKRLPTFHFQHKRTISPHMSEYFIPFWCKKKPNLKSSCCGGLQFCMFDFYYSKPPHICIDFEPKQTCSVKPMYLQLKGGGGL